MVDAGQIRKPSELEPLFAWWRSALIKRPDRYFHEPQLGFFKRKLVKAGPWVPVKFWLEQITDEDGLLIEPERMLCEVGGRAREPLDQWTWCCRYPITKSEFEFMLANAAWVSVRAPHEPEAQPQLPIDFGTSPIPF